MKKLLALVLALVMTLGLATVGANAALSDFKDADDINYEEAVAVMNAIGVLMGDESGFRPADTLKRSEGAKIVAYLMLGNKAAEAIQASGTKYTDLPANHWAAGYMEYLSSEGVMGGIGGGKIDPDGALTATAFAKMLLVALGYDAAIEGFGGDDWSINVQKVARMVGIFDGNDDVVGTAAVTREEAALYAFNTIKAPLVQYDTKVNVNINGADVTVGNSNAKYVTTTIAKEQSISSATQSNQDGIYLVEFAEKYYPKLKLESGESFVNPKTDAFARPSNRWLYDGKEIGYFAIEDTLTYTASVKYNKIYTDLGLTEGDTNVELYIDGAAKTAGNITKANDSTVGEAGNSVMTQVYKMFTNADGSYKWRITQIHNYVGTVDKTVEATSTTDAYIVISVAPLANGQPKNFGAKQNFETEAKFDDDTIVTYNFSQLNFEVYNVVATKAVEGEVSETQNATKNNEDSRTITVDGTKYNMAKKFGGENEVGEITVGGEYTVYLDQLGNAVYIEEIKTLSSNFALVEDIEGISQGSFKVNRALLLCSDGVERVVNTAKDYAKAGTSQLAADDIVSYRLNDDNTYTLKKVATQVTKKGLNKAYGTSQGDALVMESGKANVWAGGSTLNTSSKTVFVVTDGTDIDVYTGIKEAPTIKSTDAVAASVWAYTRNGIVNAMFILVGNMSIVEGVSNRVLFLAEGSASNLIHNNKSNYYEYKGAVNGEIKTVKIDESLGKTLSGIFKTYSIDSNDVVTSLSGVANVDDIYVSGAPAAMDTQTRRAADAQHGYTGYTGAVGNSEGYVYGAGISKTVDDYTVTLSTGKNVVGNGNVTLSFADDAKIYYVDKDNKIEEIQYKNITVDDNDFVYAIVDDGMIQRLFIEDVKDADLFTKVPTTAAADTDANYIVDGATWNINSNDTTPTNTIEGDLIVENGATLTTGKALTVAGDVYVDGTSTLNINTSTMAITGNLTVEEGGTLNITGNTTVGKDTFIYGHAVVDSGATVTVTGTENGSVIANNSLVITDGTVTFQKDVQVTGALTLTSGTLTLEDVEATSTADISINGGTLDVKGTVDNAGDIAIEKTATATFEKAVTNSGDIALSGNVTFEKAVTNNGDLSIEDGKTVFVDTVTNNSTIEIEKNAVVDAQTIKNSGTVDIDEKNTEGVTANITGTGTVTNKENVNDEVTLESAIEAATNEAKEYRTTKMGGSDSTTAATEIAAIGDAADKDEVETKLTAAKEAIDTAFAAAIETAQGEVTSAAEALYTEFSTLQSAATAAAEAENAKIAEATTNAELTAAKEAALAAVEKVKTDAIAANKQKVDTAIATLKAYTVDNPFKLGEFTKSVGSAKTATDVATALGTEVEASSNDLTLSSETSINWQATNKGDDSDKYTKAATITVTVKTGNTEIDSNQDASVTTYLIETDTKDTVETNRSNLNNAVAKMTAQANKLTLDDALSTATVNETQVKAEVARITGLETSAVTLEPSSVSFTGDSDTKSATVKVTLTAGSGNEELSEDISGVTVTYAVTDVKAVADAEAIIGNMTIESVKADATMEAASTALKAAIEADANWKRVDSQIKLIVVTDGTVSQSADQDVKVKVQYGDVSATAKEVTVNLEITSG